VRFIFRLHGVDAAKNGSSTQGRLAAGKGCSREKYFFDRPLALLTMRFRYRSISKRALGFALEAAHK
jgi:hypothetical protein